MTKNEVIEEGEQCIQKFILPHRQLSREEWRDLRDTIRWVYEQGKAHGKASERIKGRQI